jgi:predicted nucleic acid-binding protein
MNALLDTNIIIDALAARQPFDAEAKEILRLFAARKINCAITASTASDIYYIVRKYLKDDLKTSAELKKLFELLEIISVTKETCLAAFDTGISDYEDSLLAVCAARGGVDYIVTRNLPDFAKSSVPAISPKDFINKLK